MTLEKSAKQNSKKRSPISKKIQKRDKETDYIRVNMSKALKLQHLKYLEDSGKHVYQILELLRAGKDLRNMVRDYTQVAQEQEFDSMVGIMVSQKARSLLSKVFKLERFAVVVLFYFKVSTKESRELEKSLICLMENIWANQNGLLNWIKEINLQNSLQWVVEDSERIYSDLQLELGPLVSYIKEGCEEAEYVMVEL